MGSEVLHHDDAKLFNILCENEQMEMLYSDIIHESNTLYLDCKIDDRDNIWVFPRIYAYDNNKDFYDKMKANKEMKIEDNRFNYNDELINKTDINSDEELNIREFVKIIRED